MKGLIVRWFFLTVSILSASYLVGGIHVASFWSAILAAAVLGFLNAFFRPVLLILTLPLNLLTLGLFTFVINALLLMMVSGVIGGVSVDGFGSALLGSLIISVVSWLLTSFIGGRGTVQYIDLSHKGGNRWE
ncbi:phage holin family protein [Desulfosarcina sp. OttesenSCG-928-A07]|nr:phage holin family protein [Desulfosarcina sp. OttesenSCG-928-G17]MDL2329662.1 phage holin family protein [Desulfosarcina sp. OttesenSCG-928-A07]